MEDKQNYKRTEMDPSRCVSYIAIEMGEKIAHINWKCGQYLEIFLWSIIDPSSLHNGQKVKYCGAQKLKKS